MPGHVLDWVPHREDDGILQSTAIDHSLSSDHYCILTQLNISSPPRRKLCVEARNIASIDVVTFKADFNSRLQSSSPITAEQLHQLLVNLLNQYAPATRCKVSNRPPSLSYSVFGPQLLEAKRERRRAETR